MLSFRDPLLDIGHYQLFDRGSFVEWKIGVPNSPPDLTFVLALDDLLAILSGRIIGESALKKLRVTLSDGDNVDLPPPLDAVTHEALHRVPSIPGVRSTIGLHFHDTPFGPANASILIEEGRPKIVLGQTETPDAHARLSFALTLGYLAGDIGLMDMLKGGKVAGEWTQLMLVAGVVESSEFQHALEPVRSSYRHLLEAVEVFGAGWYRQALASAAGEGA